MLLQSFLPFFGKYGRYSMRLHGKHDETDV